MNIQPKTIWSADFERKTCRRRKLIPFKSRTRSKKIFNSFLAITKIGAIRWSIRLIKLISFANDPNMSWTENLHGIDLNAACDMSRILKASNAIGMPSMNSNVLMYQSFIV